MAEIVNLKREKKRRARADAAQEAAENRVRFGRTAAAKATDALQQSRDRRRHEAGLIGHEVTEDAPRDTE